MQATCNQMLPAVGQDVMVRFEDLTIACKVLDVKSSYGRIRLEVSPLSGTGRQWVEVSRIPQSTESKLANR
jgi:hypothetical protein